jgi:hypothetical protein
VSADGVRRRRVAVVLAAVALVALVVGVLVARGSAKGPGIAQDASRLVPSNALVYVHLSTDRDRGAVKDARELADRFPSWERARDAVLKRLAVTGGKGDVDAWLGDEMALALLGSETGTAGSLVLLQVRDEGAARSFVARGAARSGPSQEHRGVRIQRFGAVNAAFVDDFLVLGQAASLRRAIDLAQGRGDALAGEATFHRLEARLPGDRVGDAYVTADGLRRLLVPAGGGLGVAGLLLDRPNLKGAAVALDASDPGARLQVESLVPGRKAEEFEPTLTDAVPEGAMAYLGTKGLDETATRLAAVAGTAALGDLLRNAGRALGAAGAQSVQRDLLDLLRGETALAILPGLPAPTMLVIAKASDEGRTRAALDRLTASLSKLVKGAKVRKDGDVTVVSSGTTEIRAAVFDGKLVLSTSEAGIAAAREPGEGLGRTDAFEAVVGNPQKPVTSVVFLDFSQLLRLGEQTGLNDSRAYLAVKPDLTKVRAVGASSTGSGEDTNTEILFQTPCPSTPTTSTSSPPSPSPRATPTRSPTRSPTACSTPSCATTRPAAWPARPW